MNNDNFAHQLLRVIIGIGIISLVVVLIFF